jgi:hypothetical protein
VSQHLLEDHPSIQSDLCVLVPRQRVGMGTRERRQGTHPFSAAKIVSSLELRYSTVGQRVPICRLSRLLKIWDTSLRAWGRECVNSGSVCAATGSDADLKLEAPDVEEQQLQYIVLIDLLRELGDDLWLWLVL